ncbi:MAG: alpha/beta hydrolase [Anaerolineae bacterium]|jgi:epsilon-lactone hydrolase|nr:alpha/beta hydrolase [Anaerolineae bacterium]MBT7075000.1 alpha/beta hydrolase [Anaerolineae bacterium]
MLAFIFRTLLRKLFYKPLSIDELRESQNRSAKMMQKIPKKISVEGISINELRAEWVSDKNADKEKVILYLHGGGYVSGNIEMNRSLAGSISEKSGAYVLLSKYRLAPEDPFPAALEDGLAIYAWLLEEGYAAKNIFIAGLSAGGGLALAMMLALRDEGRPLPAGIILLSPWTDLTLSGASHETNAKKSVILHPENLRLWAKSYIASADPRTPHISPAFADMRGFPPMLIQVGGDEVLLDDARMVAERAESAGVDVRLSVYEKMWHVWQTIGILPESVKAFEEIGEFVKRVEEK